MYYYRYKIVIIIKYISRTVTLNYADSRIIQFNRARERPTAAAAPAPAAAAAAQPIDIVYIAARHKHSRVP